MPSLTLTLLCKLAFLAIPIGWWFIRRPHKRRAARSAVATSQWDLTENLLLAISGIGLGAIPVAYVFTGFGGVTEHATHPVLLMFGIAIGALSLVMFDKSHRGLGKEWSFSLELKDGHRLKTDGVYALVRHPMYTAFWLWALAQAILLPNWIAGLSGLVGFGCLYMFRVPREEAMMAQAFGEEWRVYAEKTPRVVPWRLVFPGR